MYWQNSFWLCRLQTDLKKSNTAYTDFSSEDGED